MTTRPEHIKTCGKYNRGRHTVIVDAVRRGNYRATAARLADVHPTQLYKWLEEGEDASEQEYDYDSPEGRFRKLAEDVEQAEAEFEASMVGKVTAAAEEPRNWTAAMTILERTRPHKFGKRDTTVLEGGEKPIGVSTINIITSPEALGAADALLKALARQPEALEQDEIPALPEPVIEDAELV